jgi:hypothetical protein
MQLRHGSTVFKKILVGHFHKFIIHNDCILVQRSFALYLILILNFIFTSKLIQISVTHVLLEDHTVFMSSFVSALKPLSVPLPLLSCGKHVPEPCESSTLGSSIDLNYDL